jgi:hypothetical protein
LVSSDAPRPHSRPRCSLVGAAAAFALREPPRVSTVRVRKHVANALRDLVRAPGLAATLAYGAVVYTALRGANALVWNPVLGTAGVPVAAYGALTAAVTLLGASLHGADAWRRRSARGARGLDRRVACRYVRRRARAGLVVGADPAPARARARVTPVLVVDLLIVASRASERRATLLSFESCSAAATACWCNGGERATHRQR